MKGMNFGLKVIIGCIIAIALWYWALIGFCGAQVAKNTHNLVYWLVLAGLVYLFIRYGKKAYAENDGAENKYRILVVVVTGVICIWSAAWVAGESEKVLGSPQMEVGK